LEVEMATIEMATTDTVEMAEIADSEGTLFIRNALSGDIGGTELC
jgi:hypothetical protein